MSGDPVELLRGHRLRVTPQRRAILGAFQDLPDEHLSADEVHSRAGVAVPEIGRGTVYSTLAELAELGLLAAVGTAEPIRYETNVAPHDHFRCRLCVRLFDLRLGSRESPGSQIDGFLVERVTVTAEGVCQHCRSYARGLTDGAATVLSVPQLQDELVQSLACGVSETPLGTLLVAASARGAVRLAFEDHADFAALAARARSRRGPRGARRRAEQMSDSLQAYFGGGRDAAPDEIDWGKAEQATTGALEATRLIPYGTPRSYEQLGVALNPYACGYAMGANPVPIVLPCHRVSCGSDRPQVWVGGARRLALVRKLESDALAGRPR